MRHPRHDNRSNQINYEACFRRQNVLHACSLHRVRRPRDILFGSARPPRAREQFGVKRYSASSGAGARIRIHGALYCARNPARIYKTPVAVHLRGNIALYRACIHSRNRIPVGRSYSLDRPRLHDRTAGGIFKNRTRTRTRMVARAASAPTRGYKEGITTVHRHNDFAERSPSRPTEYLNDNSYVRYRRGDVLRRRSAVEGLWYSSFGRYRRYCHYSFSPSVCDGAHQNIH